MAKIKQLFNGDLQPASLLDVEARIVAATHKGLCSSITSAPPL